MANPHVIDIATFRILFPAFASESAYPDGVLDVFWGSAVAYLGDYDACLLRGAGRQSALNYMTAHLLALGGPGGAIATGQVPAVVTSSTIDKVSVTMAAPPSGKSAWAYWLSLTPYGLQLWALLSSAGAGGVYIGGAPEASAFRRVYGLFRP